MIEQFAYVISFVGLGILFLILILFLAKLLRPNRPNIEKLSTYESGEAPLGNANIQFNARFYIIALLFVLFEIELIFLFPWAVVFGQKEIVVAVPNWSKYALIEMFLFLGILIIGLAFAWVKGYLNWDKPKSQLTDINSPVPKSAYQKYFKSVKL